jgi:hypothetical protein
MSELIPFLFFYNCSALVFSWKLIFAARFQSEKISLEELLHYMRSLSNKKHSFK